MASARKLHIFKSACSAAISILNVRMGKDHRVTYNHAYDLLVLKVVLMVAVRSFEFMFDTYIFYKLDRNANNYKQMYITAFCNHLLFLIKCLEVEAVGKLNVVADKTTVFWDVTRYTLC
jgi:hypothetical protein